MTLAPAVAAARKRKRGTRGPLAVRDAEYPTTELYRELRDRWIERFGASNVELAASLGVLPQTASQWATASDGRRPPLWALAALADDLRVGILITGDGLRIVTRERADAGRRRGPAEAAPAGG